MGENKAQRRRGVMRETFDDGILMNILSRLPLKRICSFKLVSKHWLGLISDKYFVKIQLAKSKENPTFILSPNAGPAMNLYSMKPQSFELSALNPIERRQGCIKFIISCFNGLICCANEISEEVTESEFCDLQISICNPCTEETLLLPRGTPSYKRDPSFGVTYASDTSDYKVFRIYCAGKKIPEEVVPRKIWFGNDQYFARKWLEMDYQCEVYSSITGSWGNIGSMPSMCRCICPYMSSHASIGGKIFWLIFWKEPLGILSVDSQGRTEDLKLPDYGGRSTDCCYSIYLDVLQGSLLLVIVRYEHETIEVWVWEEEKKVWSKKLRAGEEIALPFNEEVLGVKTLESQILFVSETCFWKYDVDTGEWETKTRPSCGFENPRVFPFTESLLPCNGSMML